MFWFPFWVRLLCGSGTGWSCVGNGAAIITASWLLDLLLNAKVQEELCTCKCLLAPRWRQPLSGKLYHSQLGYIHHRAGVAALLAALSNKECSVSFSPQQVFSLASVDISHIPRSLIVMGQVLIIFYHRVLAVEKEKCVCETQNEIH